MSNNSNKPKKQIGMKKHFLCLLLLASGGMTAYAAGDVSTDVAAVTQQGVTVKGVVKDAKGEPIIGATVTEKGTKNATVTTTARRYWVQTLPVMSAIILIRRVSSPICGRARPLLVR